MEGVMSSETIEVVKGKLLDISEIVIQFSKDHKFVLVGTGAVVGLYWYLTRTHDYFKKQGIPGPKPGLFGVFSDYRKMGIHDFDAQLMKKYGKVVGIYHARSPVLMVSDVDMIKQIKVKEFASFVNYNNNPFPVDPKFKDALVMVHDDHWKFLRSVLSPTFTSARMREMAPLIQKCLSTLLTNLEKLSEGGKKSMKMKDVFSMFTMDAIASIAFGVEVDCQGDPDNLFLKYAKKLISPGPRLWTMILLCGLFPFLTPVFEYFRISTMEPSAGNFFAKLIYGAIEQRTENDETRDDFLQLMLNSHKLEEDQDEEDPDTHLEFDKSKRRGMTKDEVLANAFIFLLAGYENTSVAMCFMAYLMAIHPECQDKVINEVDKVLNGKAPDYDNVSKLQYLENVFFESMRLYPAAVRTSRVCNEDIEINGYFIPKGLDIHFPTFAIHHDPDYWSDPETFDPDRFLPENRPENFNYVFHPFGAGPRNCIGMRLVHMEVKIAIAGILQKYRFKKAPETKIPLELYKTRMQATDGWVLMIEKR